MSREYDWHTVETVPTENTETFNVAIETKDGKQLGSTAFCCVPVVGDTLEFSLIDLISKERAHVRCAVARRILSINNIKIITNDLVFRLP